MPVPSARLLLAAAALAAAAAPAFARAPSASGAMSLDWLRERLEKERQADEKAAKQVDPLEASAQQFGTGQLPLDQWKDLADGIKDPEVRHFLREHATSMLIKRNEEEERRNTVDGALRRKFRLDVSRELLILVVGDDLKGQECVYRILSAFYPKSGVEWKPGDSKPRRARAYRDLQRVLR